MPDEREGPLVVGIDCSTTASKAVIFDASGRALASARRSLCLYQPRSGWYEQDPEDWWRATYSAVTEAIGAVQDRDRVAAICIAHQRETFVCVDRAGVALRPGILWMDARASAEIAEFGAAWVQEVSGKPADVTPALYKLAWLSRNEPQTLAATHKVLDVHAYLAHRLTGLWATSCASVDSLGLLDLRSVSYSPALLEIAGLRQDQVPDHVAPGTIMGEVRGEYTQAWGLRHPLHVVAGAGDGQAAGLGAAADGPGVAYLNLGTATVAGMQASRYRWDPAYRTLVGAVPGSFTLETLLSSGAFITSWFRDQFDAVRAGRTRDRELDSAAGTLPPGAEGLLTLPYWNCAQTPYWDPSARGAVVGWRGIHGPAHMYRSMLEGVAYEVRLHLDGIESSTGRRISTLRTMGGGARSALWTQIMADILQRPLEICAELETTALGAGILGFAAVEGAEAGEIGPLAHNMARFQRTCYPRRATAAAYDRLFGIYQSLYPNLRSVFKELDEFHHDYA